MMENIQKVKEMVKEKNIYLGKFNLKENIKKEKDGVEKVKAFLVEIHFSRVNIKMGK